MNKIQKYKLKIILFILIVITVSLILTVTLYNSMPTQQNNSRPTSYPVSSAPDIPEYKERKVYYLDSSSNENPKIHVENLETNVIKTLEVNLNCVSSKPTLVKIYSELQLVDCDTTKEIITLSSISIFDDSIKNEVSLKIPRKYPNNNNAFIKDLALSPDGQYAVVVIIQAQIANTSPDPGYIYILDIKNETFKEIMEFQVLNLGIGGKFCNEVEFSTDSENFIICQSSATGLSIQSKPFLFNKNGVLIREIASTNANLIGNKDEFFFLNQIDFLFSHSSGIYRSSVGNDEVNQLSSVFGTSDISLDKNYLMTYTFKPNTLYELAEVPVFINISSGESFQSKPENTTFLSSLGNLNDHKKKVLFAIL